ncbi:glycosyltransferase family 4 protein [candidate division KSB1 bacterium]|nr:glycosyltransferase family 4 protein [candidate division KSB1 bacterium]
MNRPVILYVHHNTQHIGGADYCLFKMVREVQKKSSFRCLVLLSCRNEICDLYRRESIPVFFHTIPTLPKSVRVIPQLVRMTLAETRCIRALAKRYKIRLVHSNDLFDFTANWAAKILGIPSCQHIRAILDSTKITSPLLSICCRLGADRIFCVSNAVRQNLFGRAERQSRVLYDWIDLETVGHNRTAVELYQELDLDSQATLIGFLGRLTQWKGPHLLIQAAPLIAERIPKAIFLFIGESPAGPYRLRLQQLAKNSQVRERLHFLGYRRDVSSLLTQLDLVVHTSTSPDPLPGVIMEAMKCGTPVVAPNSGGVPEEIRDGISGYLYPAGDWRALAHKVVSALTNSTRYDAVRRNARREVDSRFSKDHIMPQLLREYDRLIS